MVAEGMENTFQAVHKLVHHEKLVDSPKCVFMENNYEVLMAEAGAEKILFRTY